MNQALFLCKTKRVNDKMYIVKETDLRRALSLTRLSNCMETRDFNEMRSLISLICKNTRRRRS